MTSNSMNLRPTPADLPAELHMLVDAMNVNNSVLSYTPYVGFEITESRRKYHLLNHVLSNGQRSGLFLIDKETLEIRKSLAYGKAGNRVGTVASFLKSYQDANSSFSK